MIPLSAELATLAVVEAKAWVSGVGLTLAKEAELVES